MDDVACNSPKSLNLGLFLMWLLSVCTCAHVFRSLPDFLAFQLNHHWFQQGGHPVMSRTTRGQVRRATAAHRHRIELEVGSLFVPALLIKLKDWRKIPPNELYSAITASSSLLILFFFFIFLAMTSILPRTSVTGISTFLDIQFFNLS
jgi:hypothetical protein